MNKEKDVELILAEMQVSELKVYENNPRIIDKAIPQVKESIKQCGYITPIVVDEDGVILAGHTRYAALTELGVESCEVIIAKGISEEQKKKYRILDNKTGEIAKWDNKLLAEELSDIDFNGFDFGQPVSAKDFIEDDEVVEGGQQVRTVICPRCNSEVEI